MIDAAKPPVEPDKGCCRDCNRVALPFMVRDAVWLKAWPTYEEDKRAAMKQYKGAEASWEAWLLLCLECLETRLKRRLVLKDFPPLLVNNLVFFGYAMRDRQQQQDRELDP